MNIQVDYLANLISKNYRIDSILKSNIANSTGGYVVAGYVNQYIWNCILDNDPFYGIDDYDFIYFNQDDISEESQIFIESTLKNLTNNDRVEAVNQARVHIWYPKYF